MLQFGYEKVPVYCYMDGNDLGECGGGGWTLVMKIDGAQVQFIAYASINSSGAHPPPGNRGAFAYVVSPGGWALAYPVATPGHLTHVFSKDG